MSDLFFSTETTTETSYEPGGHDRFSHYVEKNEATEAAVNGWPIIALCGKIFIPSRDPDKYPICQTCKEIYLDFEGDQ